VEKIHDQRSSGQFVCRSKLTHGKHRRNLEVFTTEEFIAATSPYIPEKLFQLVRYYAGHSNRSRGDRARWAQNISESRNDAERH
jgi:hypothetical protein